jgi:pimeloyl-ACP methyl ester carboxylesterase
MKILYVYAVLLFCFALISFSACSGDSNGDNESVAADTNNLSRLPMAACGMPQYSLLPTNEVGEIIEWEELAVWDLTRTSLFALIQTTGFDMVEPLHGVKLYRYRYTTQDRGVKVEATALLGIPISESTAGQTLPIVMHPHGTCGFSDPCAPSHDSNSLEGAAIPALMTSMGYIVVAPDYIGMNGFGAASTVHHAYLSGEQSAIGSWDAVRAAEKLLEKLGNPVFAEKRVIPWGGSQGGHTVLFAELYAPYYAPEYEVPGVVALIPPSDLVPLIAYSVEQIRVSSGLFSISLGTMHLWYGEQGNLADALTNNEPFYFVDNLTDLIYPQDVCEIDVDVDLDSATVEMLYADTIRQTIADETWEDFEPWNCYYKENSLGTSSVTPLRHTPTLMVYGENDDLVYTPLMRDDFVKLCDAGYQLEYLECTDAGHSAAALWSLPEQLAWMAARLAGDDTDAGNICVVHEPTCCTGTPTDVACQ